MQSTNFQAQQSQKFAFLIHFRNSISDDLRICWKPLSLIPDTFYNKLINKVQFTSMKWGKMKDIIHNRTIGRNEFIPMSPEMFFSMGQKEVVARLDKVLDKLVAKGYKMVGLGALTSAMTLGGAGLRHRTDIGITNGNAFTAVILAKAVEKLVNIQPNLHSKQAIVGASGSVGSCMAKLLVKQQLCEELLLVARNTNRLEKLKQQLQSINPHVKIHLSTQIADIKQAKMTTLLTASSENLLSADYLAKDAVILDGTQPRNSSPELLKLRPDVTVVDGGIVSVPGIDLSIKQGIGLPNNHYFACLCETALLTLAGHNSHFSIGQPELEQAEYVSELADQYSDYGFQLAPFLSFGKQLKNSPYAG